MKWLAPFVIAAALFGGSVAGVRLYVDTGQRQRADQAEIRDYHAQTDGRRIFASMGF